MREFNINTTITVCTLEECSEQERELIEAAKESSKHSYAPYSKLQVGAAILLSDGRIVSGNNQENAAYPSGLCAERTTLFFAGASYPLNRIDMLAIAAQKDGLFTENPITPCGACRQVMIETEKRQSSTFKVVMYGSQFIYKAESANSLLPLSFA